MATNLNRAMFKLTRALNTKDMNILYSKKQFKGREGCIITMYIIEQARLNPATVRYDNVTLYKTASLVKAVLFLRDLWYLVNNQELPTNDEKWNLERERVFNIEEENVNGEHRITYSIKEPTKDIG